MDRELTVKKDPVEPAEPAKGSDDDRKALRRKITITFYFLFIMNFIRVFDNGILPAMTTIIKDDYGLTDVQVGTLGSLVYIGEVTGSLMAMPVYQKVPPKAVLLSCIVLQSVVIVGFAFSNGVF